MYHLSASPPLTEKKTLQFRLKAAFVSKYKHKYIEDVSYYDSLAKQK